MIPLRVSLEGFLSYKDKQVIDFTDSSLWMLWGPNGVGKSAVFDAITFALYNTHRAGGARGAKELINHYSDGLEVTFDFLIDGVMYRVRRTQSRARTARPTREAFTLHFDDNQDLDSAHVTPIPGTDDEDGFEQWIQRTIGLDYRAFTSSVLLLQGQSEKLLAAEPRDRYLVLAELIDLSRYQRLHKAADDERRKHKASIDSLTEQLQSEAARHISSDEIAATSAELEQKNKEWEQAQGEIGRLSGLIEQARQWESALSQLEEQREKLQGIRDLLSRREEVENSFAEWQNLCLVIPSLKQIVQQQERLLKEAESIDLLEQESRQLVGQLSEAKRNKEDADQQVIQAEQALKFLYEDQAQRLRRLTELTPLVVDLQQIEQYQGHVATLEAELAKYPPDITRLLMNAEQQARSLIEKTQVLPWLKAFAQARRDFACALEDQQEANTKLDTLRVELEKCGDQQMLLDAELTKAREEERRLLQERTSASQSYKEAYKHLKDFEQAVTKAVCDLCGQPITKEHAQFEIVRINEQVQAAKHSLDELSKQHQEATQRQQDKEQSLSALKEQIKALTSQYNQRESEQQRAQSQVRQHAMQMRNAFDTIQPPFKESIVSFAPVDDASWLETTYPADADLEVLQSEVDGKEAHENYLQDLRQKDDSRQKVVERKTVVCEQLELLTSVTDIEAARSARNEQQALKEKQESIESEIGEQKQAQEWAEKLAQEAKQEFDELDEKARQCDTDLKTARGTHAEMKRTVQMLVEALPVDWRASAILLNADELGGLERRRDSLAPYEGLHEQLARAYQTETTYKERINELEGLIASYPPEACRPPVEVEQELNDAKGRQKRVDNERSEIAEQLTQLKERQRQRQKLEEQKSQAERQHHLYRLLTELLGRDGLQLYLLRQAEDAIVELANRTLSGLSHGRNYLELRRDSDAPNTQTEKALDLVVYDYETGRHAVPTRLVSGSQRFRIAVSLALAIGRYMAREARRIESVIIDEGFGSLDKNGRDDMIQELTSLGQQLKRIILVSHQDEFANAFPNRYSFKLVDKASYVTLMEDD